MPIGSFLYGVVAGISGIAGVLHVVVSLRQRPTERTHLWFGITALLSSLLAVATWFVHTSTTVRDYVTALNSVWFVAVVATSVALVWFIAAWTGLAPRWFLLGYSAYGALLLVIGVGFPGGLVVRGVTELRSVSFFGVEPMAVHVATDGMYPAMVVFNGAFLIYLVAAVIHAWRTQARATARALTFALAVLGLGTAYDDMVGAGVIDTPYILPLCWMVVVFTMAARLLGQFRREHEALAGYSHHLQEVVAERTEHLHRRARQLDRLHEVTHATTDATRMEEQLSVVLSVVTELLELRLAILKIDAYAAEPAIVLSEGSDDSSLTQSLARLASGAVRPGSNEQLSVRVRGGGRAHNAAVLVIPLGRGGEQLGTMVLARDASASFTAEERGLAEIIRRDAAGLVLDSRVLRMLRETATSAERRRIAHELHDSVTQSLYSVSMLSDVAPATFERDAEAGRQVLAQIRGLTAAALAQLRSLLLELRPSGIETAQLDRLVHELADSFTSRTQVPVDVVVAGAPQATPEAKVAIYRVMGELLANVARHAEATTVTALLRELPGGGGRLEIRDDGRGFAMSRIGSDHHGLVIAGERLAEVGAQLEITSEVGEGTRAVVLWPPMPRSQSGTATSEHGGHDGRIGSHPSHAGG